MGYRYYNTFGVKPAYEFGHGLSYTSFGYGPPALRAATFAGRLTATLTVANTGKAAGRRVVKIAKRLAGLALWLPTEALGRWTGRLGRGREEAGPGRPCPDARPGRGLGSRIRSYFTDKSAPAQVGGSAGPVPIWQPVHEQPAFFP